MSCYKYFFIYCNAPRRDNNYLNYITKDNVFFFCSLSSSCLIIEVSRNPNYTFFFSRSKRARRMTSSSFFFIFVWCGFIIRTWQAKNGDNSI